MSAQHGRIQLEAVLSAGLNTALERGDVGSWVLFQAQLTTGCATSGKSLLPVLQFPSVCWEGAVCDRLVQKLAPS